MLTPTLLFFTSVTVITDLEAVVKERKSSTSTCSVCPIFQVTAPATDRQRGRRVPLLLFYGFVLFRQDKESLTTVSALQSPSHVTTVAAWGKAERRFPQPPNIHRWELSGGMAGWRGVQSSVPATPI